MRRKHTPGRIQGREILFKTGAFLLPLLLVVLVELGLRLFRCGYDTDLFIESPQNPDYLVLNPHASKRYFTDLRFAPAGNKELFRKKKPGGTLRFFVLGESTAIGYPYFHNGSFHRWLLYRLMHTFPEKHFEIVNLSLTAVNSYAVKGFAEALSAYSPDAVLIYAGQNEYYGGLGVASTQRLGSNPAVVNALARLRQFRTVQLLMDGYRLPEKKQPEAQLTRMELMAGRQQVACRSELYWKGLRQFEYNMNAALKLLHKKHIPVFFSNVVCNLKDLPPFVSDETSNDNAMHHYRKGQSFYREGKYAEAAASFVRAKELDLLRFRAPEELNRSVERLCSRYPSAHFVDAKRELEAYAPHRILGGELFTDHVHPNLKGYSVLAGAFYRALLESRLLPAPRLEMTREEWEKRMPVSPVDSIAAELRIEQLKAHWPFSAGPDAPPLARQGSLEEELAERLFRKEAGWLTVHSELYDAYVGRKQLDKAARIAEAAALEYAEDPVFYEQAAMLYGELGNKDPATFYLKKSFALLPSFGKARYIAALCLMADCPEEALPFLDYALAHPDGKLDPASLKPLAERAAGLKRQLAEDPARLDLLYELALVYRQMDNREGVAKYVGAILQTNPDHAGALALNASYLKQ
jgi:hypothetical protein